MSNLKKSMAAVALLLASAATASASAIRGADTIYLPIAGRAAGANNSFFRTDLFITNLSSDRVQVELAYAPAGENNNNAGATAPSATQKIVLAGNERREIIDATSVIFNQTAGTGGIVFFACREGGNCANPDTATGDLRNISVQARIYTTAGDGSTFGQIIPGIPWYFYISNEAFDQSLQRAFITGLRSTTEFRTNLGLFNYSTNTTITVRIRIFNGTGAQQGGDITRTLAPLAQVQFPLASSFSGTGFYATLEEVSFTPDAGVDASTAAHGFFAYASLLDNRSNDPTYLEAQYFESLDIDELRCLFSSKPQRRARRRS